MIPGEDNTINENISSDTSLDCGDQITDRDSFSYKTVQIGDQCWMAENLNTGKTILCLEQGGFNCSTIPSDTSEIEKWCYKNNPENCSIYGGLYSWAEAMQLSDSCTGGECSSQINEKHQGICPNDWHIPTDKEWGGFVWVSIY